MTLLIASGIVVFATVISIIINRQLLPKVSINYISMIIGAILALIPLTNKIMGDFHAELFMGLIVAPLLFFEGQYTRMNMVGHNFRLIVSLTVGMVILCTIVAGFGSALIASVGLPLAFILAAISTPTDATATESVTVGLKLPEKIASSLKMESLFNDASGIILLNIAILWYVKGHIDYAETLGSFIYSAVGGVILGSIISFLLVYIRQNLFRSRSNFGNNTYNNGTPFLVTYVLTPIIIYYLSESIEVSGIIAVVFAGLIHNAEAERGMLTNPKAMYDGTQLVDMISDVLNSFVFVVLGIMLIRTASDPNVTYHGSMIWIIVGLVLYLANLIVRYVYVRLVRHYNNYDGWVFSLGGIHGAVTFALAFTVAESQVNTADYNLVIMSESLLILLSMIVPTIIFRFVLPKEDNDPELAELVISIRQQLIDKGISEVKQMDISQEFKDAIIFDLKSQDGQTTFKQFVKEWQRMIRHPEYTDSQVKQIMRVFTQVFHAERKLLIDLYQSKPKLDEESFNKLYQEIAIAEVAVLEYDIRR
ncbi:sodium:proton antiporter [Companilactobacillus sp.]|uniref:cation:proton antiporter n=1 Tax=Companilactobacillus sp. TaxID=2767905 RepID=UPI00260BB923|nr:sodium:proton antiporter [Companilactobacillus sp.]